MGIKFSGSLKRSTSLVTFLAKLDSPALSRAVARGLNEHAEEQRRISVKGIVSYTGVPNSRVSRVTKTVKAGVSSTLIAKVVTADKAIGLEEYGSPVWSRSMPGVEATAWNRRQIFDGTFMARGMVFHRVGASRMPIRKLYGPVLANELAKPDRPNVPRARAFAELDLKKRVYRQILRELGA
jgi:hypothetical protein